MKKLALFLTLALLITPQITSAWSLTDYLSSLFSTEKKLLQYDGFDARNGFRFGATNFPTSLDTLTNPSATDSVATVSHSGQHSNANDAIEALEGKLGITASTPIADSILVGNGTGSSIWTTFATTTRLTIVNLLATGSTTLQNFTFQNATGTNATTTGAFNVGTSLVVGTTLIATGGQSSFADVLHNGSTTMQAFTGTNATTSNATTTNLYVSGMASTSNFRANSAVVGDANIGNLVVASCTGCGGNYATASITATTSLAVGDAVFSQIAATSTFATSTDGVAGFTGFDYICFPGQPDRYAERMDSRGVGIANVLSFDLAKVGSPTGSLRFSIYKGTVTTPTGNPLQSGFMSIANLTTAFATTTVNLASTTIMNEGDYYWAVVQAEGYTCDASNYVRTLQSATNNWGGGIANRYSGSWLNDVNGLDIPFRIGFTGVAKMPGGVPNYASSFVGFATEATATGTPQTTAVSGAPSLFSGLTPGSFYYGSTTLGQISATEPYGAASTPICLAISTTACKIK